jgi:hypothetical protein
VIQQTTLQLIVQTVDNATAKLNAIGDQVNGVSNRISGATGAVTALRSSFVGLAASIGAAQFFRELITNSIDAQRAQVELEAAIRRTGGAAGITSARVKELATEIQRTSRFSDEAVQDAATRLTLFTNVTGSTFERALKVSADLAARMGTDVPEAVAVLGRALQSPGDGLRSLVQYGVRFNDEQVKTLQYMNETGKAAQATSIILDELAKRTGGAATESVMTLGGAFSRLKNVIGDTFESTSLIDSMTFSVNRLTNEVLDLTGNKLDTMKRQLEIKESKRRSPYNTDEDIRNSDADIAKLKE